MIRPSTSIPTRHRSSAIRLTLLIGVLLSLSPAPALSAGGTAGKRAAAASRGSRRTHAAKHGANRRRAKVTIDPCAGDDRPPIITCPADVIIAPVGCSLVVPIATARDDCDTTPRVRAYPPRIDGAGEHHVTYTAVDRRGNVAACGTTMTLVCDRCAAPPDGLVASWRCATTDDESSLIDLTARASGTLENGAACTTIDTRPALSLDGDKGFARAIASSMHAYVDLTVTAWVRPRRLGEAMDIISFGAGLYGLTLVGDELTFFSYGAPRWFSASTRGAGIRPGRFTHVAVVADRTAGHIRFHVDGREVESSALAYGNASGLIGIGWTLGRGSSGFFDGEIGEVAVFERPLDDAEIRSVYEARTAGLCAPGESPPPPPAPADDFIFVPPGRHKEVPGDDEPYVVPIAPER